MALTGTTGMACQQYLGLDAHTVQNWLGLKDGRYTKEQLLEYVNTKEEYATVRKHFLEDKVLITDEISMLSEKLLETIEYLYRNVRRSKLIFGGIQRLAVGDFRQLPPIAKNRYSEPGHYCFLSACWSQMFPHTMILDQAMRHRDITLCRIVSEIANGDTSEETDLVLNGLNNPLLDTMEPTILHAKNLDVDLYNSDCLLTLPGPMKIYTSVDTGMD